ncbi:unnamed protein product [Leuciscus chuanchicus]
MVHVFSTYDSSSVKLSVLGNSFDDYINASYMPGYTSKKEFIAAQGPLPCTVNDFWRLIWEKNVHTIVLLTKCNEQGRVKCEEYWPADIKHLNNLTVMTTSEIPLEDWTLRDFEVKNVKTAESRSVRHFHFTAWPDHGVPETTELLINFRHLVREHMDQYSRHSPTLVHCSADVGRTGTFIAIDRLIFQIERDGVVDVYGIIHDLRMHRPLMVQTEVDGGGREEREKGVRKKRKFWKRLFCLHFPRPKAGKGEKVKQSEIREQEAEAGPSRSTDEIITCTVEDCDHQEELPDGSPDVLASSEDQQMQELLQPRVQDSPVILSEGEIESPQTEQQDNDVGTIMEDICSKYDIGDLLGEGGFGSVYAGVRVMDNLPSTPHIKLLDWQDLPNHYIMVLQRPSPCVTLFDFLQSCGGIFNEEIACHVMRQVVEVIP